MDTTRSRDEPIDGLRAVAALAVIYGHAGPITAVAADPGWLAGLVRDHSWNGVHLFFAISGYLIARPFVRAAVAGTPAPDLRAYARRRAARILPAYWLALIGAVLFLPGASRAPVALLSHAALLHDWVPGESRSVLPVGWTLSIEATFYALVPLTALAVLRRRPRIARRDLYAGTLAAGVLSLALWVAGNTPGAGADAGVLLDDNIPGLLVFFCPGVLIAVAETDPRLRAALGRRRWASPALLASGVALWAVAAQLSGVTDPLGPRVILGQPVLAVAAGLVLAGAVAAPASVALAFRPLRHLGRWSYGLYLWHTIVLQVLVGAHVSVGLGPAWARQGLGAAVLTAATVPLAWASWRFVEAPLIRWAASRGGAPRVTTGRAAAPGAA